MVINNDINSKEILCNFLLHMKQDVYKDTFLELIKNFGSNSKYSLTINNKQIELDIDEILKSTYITTSYFSNMNIPDKNKLEVFKELINNKSILAQLSDDVMCFIPTFQRESFYEKSNKLVFEIVNEIDKNGGIDPESIIYRMWDTIRTLLKKDLFNDDIRERYIYMQYKLLSRFHDSKSNPKIDKIFLKFFKETFPQYLKDLNGVKQITVRTYFLMDLLNNEYLKKNMSDELKDSILEIAKEYPTLQSIIYTNIYLHHKIDKKDINGFFEKHSVDPKYFLKSINMENPVLLKEILETLNNKQPLYQVNGFDIDETIFNFLIKEPTNNSYLNFLLTDEYRKVRNFPVNIFDVIQKHNLYEIDKKGIEYFFSDSIDMKSMKYEKLKSIIRQSKSVDIEDEAKLQKRYNFVHLLIGNINLLEQIYKKDKSFFFEIFETVKHLENFPNLTFKKTNLEINREAFKGLDILFKKEYINLLIPIYSSTNELHIVRDYLMDEEDIKPYFSIIQKYHDGDLDISKLNAIHLQYHFQKELELLEMSNDELKKQTQIKITDLPSINFS